MDHRSFHSPAAIEMLILRFMLKSAVLWIVTRLFGKFLPILARLLKLIPR